MTFYFFVWHQRGWPDRRSFGGAWRDRSLGDPTRHCFGQGMREGYTSELAIRTREVYACVFAGHEKFGKDNECHALFQVLSRCFYVGLSFDNEFEIGLLCCRDFSNAIFCFFNLLLFKLLLWMSCWKSYTSF